LFLFISGAIAICAMILPGVSGAFILLILGAYETFIGILNQLREGLTSFNIDLLWQALSKIIIIGIGAILGLKLFSKILTWMFKNHKNTTLAILTGFMIGSLNKLWPWKKILSWRTNSEGHEVPFIEKSVLPNAYEADPRILWVLLSMTIGFVLILMLEKLATKKEK